MTEGNIPRLVFADGSGRIYDHPELGAIGNSGEITLGPTVEEFIPLPPGSKLFRLPGCRPLGWDSRKGKITKVESISLNGTVFQPDGVAAFMAPGYTRSLLPAVDYQDKDYVLPLWPYTALGWKDDEFWVAGVRIDDNFRWNPDNFDDTKLVSRVEARLASDPGNRLVKHLANCATVYHCFAAKNFFMSRWECPIPTSPYCNANCLGCLSLQPDDSCLASHERIKFIPSVSEIVNIAVPHLEDAPDPIVSFGQGCEGEPLMVADTIAEAVAEIRRQTKKGVINLNSNASLPRRVQDICEAGLDSLRVSLSSVREDYYRKYFRNEKYSFDDVLKSLEEARRYGLFISLNLFIFPGISDQAEEIEALVDLIARYKVDLIQMRNLSIDPQLYLRTMESPPKPGIGIRELIKRLGDKFSNLKFGYFNKSKEQIN